jgi:hypothetical protein
MKIRPCFYFFLLGMTFISGCDMDPDCHAPETYVELKDAQLKEIGFTEGQAVRYLHTKDSLIQDTINLTAEKPQRLFYEYDDFKNCQIDHYESKRVIFTSASAQKNVTMEVQLSARDPFTLDYNTISFRMQNVKAYIQDSLIVQGNTTGFLYKDPVSHDTITGQYSVTDGLLLLKSSKNKESWELIP